MDLSQLSQIKENDKAKVLINEATQANAQVVKNSVNQTSINVSATYSFLSVLTGEGGKITNDELALSQVKLQRQLASLAQDPQKAENANGAPKQKPLMELVSKLISRDLDLQEEVAFNLTTRLEIVKTSDAVDTLKSYCDTLPKVFQESNDAGKALMKYLCEVIVNKTTSDNISPAMTRQLAMEQIFAPDGELTPKTSMILDKLLGATIEFIRANQPDVLASLGRESSQVLSPNSTRAQMASFIMESLGDEVDDATYLDIFTSKSKDFTDEQSEVIAKRVEEIITKAADTARSANLLDDEPKTQSENQENNLKDNKPLDITVRELNRRSGEIQKSIDDDALENIQKDTIKRESIEELAEKIKKEFSAQNSNVDKNIASKTIEEKPQQIDKELDKLEKNNNQEANLEKENIEKKSTVNQNQLNEVSKNNETIKGNETTNERDLGILREAIVKNLADSIKNNTQENQESFIKNIDLENEFENFELPKSNVQGEPLTQGDEERIKYILSNAASAARNSNLLDSNDELPQNKTSILVDESLVKKQVYDELNRSLGDDNNAKNLSNQTSKTFEVKENIQNQDVKESTNPQITDNDNEAATLNKVDSKNDALNKVLDSEEKFTSEIKDILQKADDIRNFVGSKALDVDNDNINNTNNKENTLNTNKPLENKVLNPNESLVLSKAQETLKPNNSNESLNTNSSTLDNKTIQTLNPQNNEELELKTLEEKPQESLNNLTSNKASINIEVDEVTQEKQPKENLETKNLENKNFNPQNEVQAKVKEAILPQEDQKPIDLENKANQEVNNLPKEPNVLQKEVNNTQKSVEPKDLDSLRKLFNQVSSQTIDAKEEPVNPQTIREDISSSQKVNINTENNAKPIINNNSNNSISNEESTPFENKPLNNNEAQILAKAQDALKPNSSNDSVVNNTTQNNSQFENESKNTQEVNQKVQNDNELFTQTKISNEPNSLLNDKDLEEGISQGIKLSDLENALNKTQENKEVKPNLDEKIIDNSKINANSLEENDLEDKALEINNKENSNQALKPNGNEEILINNLPNDEDNQIQKIGDNLLAKDNKALNVNLNTLVNDENLVNDNNKSNISSKLPNEKLIIEKAFEGIKNSSENDPIDLVKNENNLTQKSSLNPLNKEGVKTSLDGLKEPQESVVLTKNNEETNQVNKELKEPLNKEFNKLENPQSQDNKELSNEKTGLDNKSNDVLSQNKPLETSSKNPNINDLLNDSKENSQNNDGKNSLANKKPSTNEGLKNTLDLIAKKLADNNGSRTNPYINQDSSKASESLKETNLPNNAKNELADSKIIENSNKNPSTNEEVKDVSRTIKESSSTPKNNVEAQNLPNKDNGLENSSNVNNKNEPLPKVNETSRVLENVYNKYSVGKPSYENTPNDNLVVNNPTTNTESTIKFDNKLDDDALLPKDVNDEALEARQEEHYVESKPTLFKRFFGMFKKEAPSNIEINNTQEPIKENIAGNEVKGDIKNVNLNDSSMGSMVNNLGRIINDGKITPEIRDMAKHIQEAMTNPLGDLQAVSEWLGLVSAPMSASGPRAQAMQQWALLLLTIRFKQLGKKIDKFKNTDEFKKLLENVKLGNDKNWPQNSLNQTLSHIEKLQNNNQDSAYPIPSYIPLPPTYEKGHEGALMIEHQKDEDNEIEWKLNFFFDLDKIGAMQVKTSLKVPNLKIQVVTESLVGLQKVKETIDTLTKRFGEYGLNVSNVSARLGTVYPPKKLESSNTQTNVSNNDGLSFRI